MQISELIAPSRVISRARSSSKKRLLEYISVAFSHSVPGLTSEAWTSTSTAPVWDPSMNI